MASTEAALTPEQERKRTSTMLWVTGIALVGLIFDGYDLVVYGAVLPDLIADPSQLNVQLTKESAGVLGSYAMIGVMIGALATGAIVDMMGRRKVMLISYTWFSIGMLITALQASYLGFAIWRTFTGVGVGALVACTGAIVAEFAPPGKKNTATAITYAGVPIGSLLAALLAMALKNDTSDWRMLFMIGALPLVTLLPLAFFKMPESIAWLASRGKMEQAQKLSEKTGVPIPALPAAPTADQAPAKDEGPAGFAGLFSGYYFLSTVLIGLLSAACLLLVYALNTFLPLIMQSKGTAVNPLAFLLVLNGGAVIRTLIGSRIADKFGPKVTVTVFFAIGAFGILLMTAFDAAGLLLVIIAVVGLGTSGTQTLIYALGATFYRTNVRGAGVSWTAGFGRIGGIIGPIVGGILTARYGPEMIADATGKQVPVVGTGNLDMVFYILAAIAVFGLVCTILLRKGDTEGTPVATIQPTRLEARDPNAGLEQN